MSKVEILFFSRKKGWVSFYYTYTVVKENNNIRKYIIISNSTGNGL